MAPSSVLDGADAAACAALGIRNLRHRSALAELCDGDRLSAGAVRAVYTTIANNWRQCHALTCGGRSTQNWRWRRPQLDIAERNRSPEVMLERALVQMCERSGDKTWANQVPVASGIAGPSRERRRAIDFVHRLAPGHFELVELKIASDNPLFAAFEIIGYTCVWLLSRRAHAAPNEILAAHRIDAVVWAPTVYYARYDLSGLAALLDGELSELGTEHGVELRFRFDTFPDELAVPPYDDERVRALLDARRAL